MSQVILVTGGAGFIGSHCVLTLLESNYEIIVMDNLSNAICTEVNQNGLPESLRRIELITSKKIQFYNTDLLDARGIAQIFRDHKISAVIHFAGLKAVGESMVKPLEYYENNVAGTINLLKVMREYNVKNLIFSSSATVYGLPQYLPIDENHPTGSTITNPYGRTKFVIERILEDLSNSEKDWCIVSLRYFNPIGAHESGEIGEDPQGIPNNLMPFISQVAVGRRPKLQVFGDDFKTKDGTGVRDYIHVIDLARGHVIALDKVFLNKWSGFKVFNLGNGCGLSVLEVIDAFEKANGVKVPYEIVARRPGDVDAMFADNRKALEVLGWKPHYSITDMCKHTWKWQSKNPRGYRSEDM
ncbi:UDP-glucose 4-epimerase [Tetranychus urticae]|nr:UDP-glucose 4-epimerase [Tetranychus urticae]XP_015794966.1 UDP-glucose 4-epimerase [Tetranychus urticae]